MNDGTSNLDRAEIAHFNAMAALWWNRGGEFKALHDINPVRVAYVARRAVLAGRRVIDVGCGGGLLAEALARHGAQVIGIDMADEALAVAEAHARRNGVAVEYRQTTAETAAGRYGSIFDIVTCMELLEHVPDPAGLVDACARLARPGGDIFFATVNRTPLSRLLVIWAAEYLFGIVRKGTHHYGKLVRPAELAAWGERAGLGGVDLSGLRYIPFIGKAALCRDTALNYLMHFKKRPDLAPSGAKRSATGER